MGCFKLLLSLSKAEWRTKSEKMLAEEDNKMGMFLVKKYFFRELFVFSNDVSWIVLRKYNALVKYI